MDLRYFALGTFDDEYQFSIGYDLMSRDSFFATPTGLGFEEEADYVRVGTGFYDSGEHVDKQIEVSGSIIFSSYAKYREFVNYVSVNSKKLVLRYATDISTFNNGSSIETIPVGEPYSLNVVVTTLSKGELSNAYAGHIVCEIKFTATSNWYKVVDYGWKLATSGYTFDVDISDTSMDSPFVVFIDKGRDPTITLYMDPYEGDPNHSHSSANWVEVGEIDIINDVETEESSYTPVYYSSVDGALDCRAYGDYGRQSFVQNFDFSVNNFIKIQKRNKYVRLVSGHTEVTEVTVNTIHVNIVPNASSLSPFVRLIVIKQYRSV